MRAGASTAYVDVIDYSVSRDGHTLMLTLKNTGNEPATITKIDLGRYGSYTNGSSDVAFYPGGSNWRLDPGAIGVVKITGDRFPTSGELTVVIVGDKFSRGSRCSYNFSFFPSSYFCP